MTNIYKGTVTVVNGALNINETISDINIFLIDDILTINEIDVDFATLPKTDLKDVIISGNNITSTDRASSDIQQLVIPTGIPLVGGRTFTNVTVTTQLVSGEIDGDNIQLNFTSRMTLLLIPFTFNISYSGTLQTLGDKKMVGVYHGEELIANLGSGISNASGPQGSVQIANTDGSLNHRDTVRLVDLNNKPTLEITSTNTSVQEAIIISENPFNGTIQNLKGGGFYIELDQPLIDYDINSDNRFNFYQMGGISITGDWIIEFIIREEDKDDIIVAKNVLYRDTTNTSRNFRDISQLTWDIVIHDINVAMKLVNVIQVRLINSASPIINNITFTQLSLNFENNVNIDYHIDSIFSIINGNIVLPGLTLGQVVRDQSSSYKLIALPVTSFDNWERINEFITFDLFDGSHEWKSFIDDSHMSAIINEETAIIQGLTINKIKQDGAKSLVTKEYVDTAIDMRTSVVYLRQINTNVVRYSNPLCVISNTEIAHRFNIETRDIIGFNAIMRCTSSNTSSHYNGSWFQVNGSPQNHNYTMNDTFQSNHFHMTDDVLYMPGGQQMTPGTSTSILTIPNIRLWWLPSQFGGSYDVEGYGDAEYSRNVGGGFFIRCGMPGIWDIILKLDWIKDIGLEWGLNNIFSTNRSRGGNEAQRKEPIR